jgi:tripartite ATP-independent transporter DctP family solute receptor
MATINRRNVMRNASTLAAFSLTAPFVVRADEPLRLKLGNDLPLSHPNTVRTQEAIDSIAKESSGKLKVELFPNNQMGGDNDMLSQVRSGALELFLCTGQLLSTLVPVVSVYGVSYAFTDYATVWRAMDGELGSMVRSAAEKAGLHVFDKMWDAGFRHVAAIHHPIVAPDDLKGFKIRVPISPLWTSTFSALGASPVSIPFAQVYSALQTGLVDGQDVSLDGLESAKFYEVVKYGSLTRHMWEGFMLVANAKIWRTVPVELQGLLNRTLDAAALKARDDIMKDSQTLQATLSGKGMIFNEPKPQPFREVLSKVGYYATWKSKYGNDAWTTLEKFSGSLA